jgi:hypothetical protein
METKKEYTAPEIELIILDNEISLVLASNPPAGPAESRLEIEHYHNSPIKNLT